MHCSIECNMLLLCVRTVVRARVTHSIACLKKAEETKTNFGLLATF